MLYSSNGYGSSKLRTKVLNIAESYVGVEELTGRNDGKFVRHMLANVNLKEGNPWCGAFGATVYKEAGINTTMTGWSKSCCPDKNLVYKIGVFDKGILPATSFWWPRQQGGHTGIIVEWPTSGSYFYTIEGNVRNGRKFGGVHRMSRKKSAVHLVGDWIQNEELYIPQQNLIQPESELKSEPKIIGPELPVEILVKEDDYDYRLIFIIFLFSTSMFLKSYDTH